MGAIPRHLSLQVLALLLFGCANVDTVSVTRIDATTMHITARTGAFANNIASRNAVLLRAAEETLRYNRRSFMVVDPEFVSRTERFWSIDWRPLWVTTDPTGPRDILIRMRRRPKEANAPANVFDAEVIIESIGNGKKRR